MQSVYRVIVCPYSYDSYSIFTQSKEQFDEVSKYRYTDELRKAFGEQRYEDFMESYIDIKFPYVILGETELRQFD